MNTLIIIAMTLLFGYTLTVCVVNRGVPSSLSATFYALPPMGAWLWTFIIGAVSGLTLPVILETAPNDWAFLAFIAIVGLLFVAVCPLVPDKGDMTYKIHIGGAVVCAVCSQLLIAVTEPKLLLLWIPWAIAYVWITKDGKWKQATFWAEMTCFVGTFILCLS
jgi:hypothetical protein